jgi:LmbE family N-acetylglucosaminyl deacetylase
VPGPVALALFAHPDDETLACGGTLAVLADAGWSVRVVFATDGRITARPTPSDNRDDAASACAVLGTTPPVFLDFPDQRLDTVAVADVVNAVRDCAPETDLVITNAGGDLNLDHQIVSHVARVVARPTDRPVALLEAEVPAAGAWNGTPAAPNWFVDVTATLSRKLEALARYSGEKRTPPHPCSPEAVEALARVQGSVSGLGLAEGFRLVRGTRDLLP